MYLVLVMHSYEDRPNCHYSVPITGSPIVPGRVVYVLQQFALVGPFYTRSWLTCGFGDDFIFLRCSISPLNWR